MKKLNISLWLALAIISIGMATAFSGKTTSKQETDVFALSEAHESQTINLFVTHGHCSTPFAGQIENLKLIAPVRSDQANPIENLELSFEINPNTFNVCASEDLSAKLRMPGLFVEDGNEKITFQSTEVYTMGLDWYQLNGKMSIKGVEKDVKFFVSGIRDPKDSRPSILVLEGQLNLMDWGIDYDKIVKGESDPVPTKWMHLNMKINMS